MRSKNVIVGGDGNELIEAPKDGNYQIGRGFYRFKQGDKIPANAQFFESGAPKVSTVGRRRAAAEAKTATRRGGAENAKGAGASETTQGDAPKA